MITPIKIDKNKLIVSTDHEDSAQGVKEKSTEVVIMGKPKESDWFIIYGDTLEDLHLCNSVKLKGDDKKEHAFLVYGGEEFQEKVREDFGKVSKFWPVLFKTAQGRCGIWNVNKPIAHFGTKNSWLVSALNIIELGQSKWMRILPNHDAQMNDVWVHKYQDSCPPKEFEKTYEEYIAAGWGDYILSEENYDENKLVQAHLAGVKVKQEIKESKK
ncbi:MAG TPA: hypothetical protein DCS66_20415 [Flavobacteriaceae bacterium]|nr:hypothetical protein [Flavobacteriaceae bacterium]|tara:strand:- start:1135 stop:1776 length:642 start_codon:yes stop_codon:yes gene_type:complete